MVLRVCFVVLVFWLSFEGGSKKSTFFVCQFRFGELKAWFSVLLPTSLSCPDKLCSFTDVRQTGINSCPPSEKSKH